MMTSPSLIITQPDLPHDSLIQFVHLARIVIIIFIISNILQIIYIIKCRGNERMLGRWMLIFL